MRNHRPLRTSSKTDRKIPLLPVCLVAAGALVAFFVWTVPNWEVFAQNVRRFPALWQIVSNRHAILLLVINVASPLLVGSLLTAGTWLWYLIKPFLQQETQPPAQESRHTSDQVSPSHRPIPSTQPQSLTPTTAIHRTPSLTQRATMTPRIVQEHHFPQPDPETPLPPTLDLPYNDAQETRSRNGAMALLHQQQEQQAGSMQDTEEPWQGPPYGVTITLLKKVSMTLTTAQGISRVVPLTLHAKRVQLLAYVAWVQGQPVHRDRLLEQVFGHGKDDEEATREKLGEAFDSHKKLIRSNLREAVAQLNAEAGGEVLPCNLDIFSHEQRLYWLSEVCHVTDLEEIEQQHQIIEAARKSGLLVDQVPYEVKQACDRLITAYTGDFLEELVTDYLDDFEPWAQSWARKPYTQFRDYYFAALWYAAEYERLLGQRCSESERDQQERRTTIMGRAAHQYRTYAMNACRSRFDMKVAFGSGGRGHGERVVMSERALRRCLVLYGSIGETYQVDQVYSAYYKQMRIISAKAWEPSKATLADLRAAKEQTSAYRFPEVTPHEPSMDARLETSA